VTSASSASGRASATSPVSVVPQELRCEGRIAPAGIELAHPMLSWHLAAAPNARAPRQTAFHILVATSSANLAAGIGDRWDSGIVTDSTTRVPYHGATLHSLERLHWAVRTRDDAGRWSEWNTSGQWTMGLLDPAREWTADWIHLPPQFSASPSSAAAVPPDPWFRREVHFDTPPSRAVALVASIGFHELYVNGCKVGDAVLVPNVCDGSRRAFYLQYEIEAYLRPGANVLALWLGAGWSVYPHFRDAALPAQPMVSALFHWTRGDEHEVLVTDASWLARPSPSRLVGTWEFQDFGGESYDARAEIPGWAQPNLRTDGWRPAVVRSHRIPLRADPAEPNRLQEALHPVEISELAPGVHRIDFGRNFAGFVEIALTAAPGTRIALEFSESPARSITHAIRSEYIVGPSGTGTFRNRFNYGVGRWLTVRGNAVPPDPARTRAWCVRNDYRSSASFASSSERLNAIAAASRWTFENLTIGGFVADCPHRERMGYGGDGHATLLSGLYQYRLDTFFAKWNRDWHDAQGHPPRWSSRHDPSAIEPPPSNHPGELPYTAPTYWGGGGPAWSGLCIQLPWQLYRFYGDRRILEHSLPPIARWLDFLETKVSGHLLRRWGGKWDFLGDWLAPDVPRGVNSDRRETLFFNNCYRVWSLATAAKIALVLNETSLAATWQSRAADARLAIHREFYDHSTASYVDSSQACLAAALLAGIPPADLRPAIERRLEKEIRDRQKGHIGAGITGGALLFQYLLENDRHDLLHLMVGQPGYPGWAYMLERGATTLWETWDEPKGNLSSLHSSFLYVGAWPIGGVLGISPVASAPGFERVRICPGPIDAPDLTWARGHFDSVRGRIAVTWRREHSVFMLEVEIPPGVVGEIGLPGVDPVALAASQQPLTEVSGLTILSVDSQRTFVAVPAGVYRFRSSLAHLETSAPPA